MSIINIINNKFSISVLACILGIAIGSVVTKNTERKITEEKITQITKDHQIELTTAIEVERKKIIEAQTTSKQTETVYVDRIVKITNKDGSTSETTIHDTVVNTKDTTSATSTSETEKENIKIVEKIVDHNVEKIVEKRVEVIPEPSRFSLGLETSTPYGGFTSLYDFKNYRIITEVGIRVVNNFWISGSCTPLSKEFNISLKYEIRF